MQKNVTKNLFLENLFLENHYLDPPPPGGWYFWQNLFLSPIFALINETVTDLAYICHLVKVIGHQGSI